MCSEVKVVEMIRGSKTPVSSRPASVTASTSRDHEAASDRRGAVDRNVRVDNGMLNNNEESGNSEAIEGEETDVRIVLDSEMNEASDQETAIDRGAMLPVGMMDSSHLQDKLNDAQLKFERACQQIVSLDQKIKDLEVRYKRAVKNKQNSFRYNLRLRLSVFTGIKMMYHHYAGTKADELTRLHRQRHTSARETSASADTRESS